jgi:hypothetical protein
MPTATKLPPRASFGVVPMDKGANAALKIPIRFAASSHFSSGASLEKLRRATELARDAKIKNLSHTNHYTLYKRKY